MALAKDLQIYKDTFEMVDKLTTWKANFARMYRYDLGEKMTSVSLELFEYIQLANMYPDNRQQYMMGFRVKFELLKTILNLCFKRKLFSPRQAADICRLTTNIGKQATAWGKSRKGSTSLDKSKSM